MILDRSRFRVAPSAVGSENYPSIAKLKKTFYSTYIYIDISVNISVKYKVTTKWEGKNDIVLTSADIVTST